VNIKGSVAFVTGANRGLGREFALELLVRRAAKIYAGVRNPDGFDMEGVVPVRIDVTDEASVAAAAAQCADTTLLINNAGIGRTLDSTLDPAFIAQARELFETNFHGIVRVTQAFAPALVAHGGGAIVNVLSEAAWVPLPGLAAYSASKSAAWSYTNAVRAELRSKGTQVLGLHVGFLDTDLTHGLDLKKGDPRDVAAQTLQALSAGQDEVIADEGTWALKKSLSTAHAYYLEPSRLG
jgi:NAD(P)-dependent dehydrogenase (short-subunit alcohol dehydrogenase family)